MYIGIYFFQRFNIFINRFFIFIFDCFFQLVQNQIRSAEFYTSLKDFTETGVVIKNRITLFDGGINFADYFFIIGVAFGFSKCCELGFLFCFCFQYLVVDNGFIHADRVFPIVAGTCIFAGVLDTYFVTGSHFFLQYILTHTTYADTGFVGRMHPLFHFTLSQIAVSASGESHNHGIVTLVNTFQGDSQMLFGFQRNIVFIIFCRFAVGIRINAEDGKVASMAGPHPVVCFTTEFTDG